MSEMNNDAWVWAAKGAGALAGSAISLAYMMPRSVREAALRLAVGIVSGLVFGTVAGLKIAHELDIEGAIGTGEMMLMGAAAASLCAWWALGFVMRIFSSTPRGLFDFLGKGRWNGR